MIEEKNELSEDVKENHNLWIDISDPIDKEITNLENQFSLNKKALEKIRQFIQVK